MELMTRGVRPSGMMFSGQVRGTVLAVLLCSALAGCGSVTASSATGGAAAGSTTSSAPVSSSVPVTSSAAAAPSALAVGCAGADLATSVTVHRVMHLVEPTRMGALSTTQHKT